MAWRYHVVGFLDGQFGLAIAARNSIRALSETGRLAGEVNIRIVPPRRLAHRLRDGWTRWRSGTSRAARAPAPDAGHRVNLFQMNPLELAWFSPQWRDAVTASAWNVCVPFWELPRLPRGWLPMLRAVDAVLAPTRFVQAACAEAVPPDRVLHYPQAVFLPEGVRPDRMAWGLSPTATVFVVSFDPGSDIDRKNPWAAIDSFRRAFPRDADVRLVIKTRPMQSGAEHLSQAEALRERVGDDPRVLIVDRTLSYEEVLGLYATCDVMVSLHRSEGLGLHLMEAMSLGKVVVATGWSGNTDFMSERDSVPVEYRLVPVRTGHSHYQSEVGRAGQVWAEPDVESAARAMRLLHDEPVRRHELGAAAARSMAKRRELVLGGGAWEVLEDVLERAPHRRRGLGPAVRRSRLHALARQVRAAVQDVRSRRRPR
jgi:glycosyltransferase involved in cell wall biosynthesis